ncbi:MAG: low molecular weight protein-tyrosine-phosphatase [Bacillota bacterium]
MKRVCFICLGNICRSTMAEFLFARLVADRNLQNEFYIQSRATSSEAVGWGVYDGTAKILDRFLIDYSSKRSTQLEKSDADKYDFFICMDESNISGTKRIIKKTDGVICKLLDFSQDPRNVLDPYYTRDFEATYRDISAGLEDFLSSLGY